MRMGTPILQCPLLRDLMHSFSVGQTVSPLHSHSVTLPVTLSISRYSLTETHLPKGWVPNRPQGSNKSTFEFHSHFHGQK